MVTGSLFLGEIGNPERYKTSKQIEKLAGLHLVENSSGEKRGIKSISKRGRNVLRYVGYLVTNIAISKNKEIKAMYQYKMQQWNKKEKMKVLCGINEKILRMMFAVCKKRQFYRPEEVKKYWREKKVRVRPCKTSIRLQ